MAESTLLKDILNKDYLQKLAADIKTAYAPFEANAFVESVMDETWDNLELKARGRHITLNLGKFLPKDYKESISIIDKIVIHQGSWLDGFAMFFPDYVEVYGQDEENWDTSMAALARYTIHASAEFAVRPFIINHEECMMAQMLAWASHEDENVRRLASEGCRPALPWAQALNSFKKDPSPVLPILEKLKNDSSLFVRRSVANNLNDISKTHPDLVAKIARKWYGENENVNWVVKHACRTLLKKGHRDVLAIFGYDSTDNFTVSGFTLEANKIAIGGDLQFSFEITAKNTAKVRLEYAIDFVKANGKTSRKIFQISESLMKENQKKRYDKKHSFADLSTRKHYPGEHAICLIVNGEEQDNIQFDVTM